MKTISFLMGALIGLTIVLSGCGKITDNVVSPNQPARRTSFPRVALTTDKLIGTWNSECYLIGKGTGMDRWTIYGSNITSKRVFYSDFECKSPYSSKTFQSTYVSTGDFMTETYYKVTVRAYSQNAASDFSTQKKCNQSNWVFDTDYAFLDPAICKYPAQNTASLALYGTTDLFLKQCDNPAVPATCVERKLTKQ